MEDDYQDGPFTVWQKLNEPTVVLFNNLEHAVDGLDRLITSILKFSGDFSEDLVPRVGYEKYPEVYYSAFNTWLIGRLFYIWSEEYLLRIHTASKDAQLKILNILCIGNASFYSTIQSEYISALNTLVKYYEDSYLNSNIEITLPHFAPEKVEIPFVQINLDPIFVKVKNLKTCKHLINLILQLLSDNLPINSMKNSINNFQYKSVLKQGLYILENFSVDLKLNSLNFFSNLVKNYKTVGIAKFQYIFADEFREVLNCLEAIVHSLENFYEQGEIDNIYIKDINKVIGELIRDSAQHLNEEHKSVVSSICIVMLKTKRSDIFSHELKLQCLALSHKLNYPKDIINVESMVAKEIDAVSIYYSKNIIKHVNNTKAVDLNENWFFNQLIMVVKTLQSCEETNTDSFIINHHLERCFSSLSILQNGLLKSDRRAAFQSQTQYTTTTLKSLLKLIKLHKAVLLDDKKSLVIFLNIILSVVVLNSNLTTTEGSKILQLLCLQNNVQFSEKDLRFDNSIKIVILKYLLIIKLILKTKCTETWNIIINFLTETIFKEKMNFKSEVIELCPLLQLNKTYSASRLIGDVLMPCFLSKDHHIQAQVCHTLPAIACSSLGLYSAILDTYENNIGHQIFLNSAVNISVLCSKCHRKNISKEMNKPNSNILGVEIYKEDISTSSNQSTIAGLQSLLIKFLNYKQYVDMKNVGVWNLLQCLSFHFDVFKYNGPKELICEENIESILEVFKPFNEDLQDNDEELNSRKDVFFITSVNLLASYTKSSLESNNLGNQTKALNMIVDLGMCRNEKVILPTTKLLIYFIMHPQCPVGPKAVVYLRDICEAHEYTSNQVYHRYKKDYCRLFVECSLYNGKDFALALSKVVRAFGFVGYRDFISKDVRHFLPYLMPYSVTIKEVPSMIEEFASLVQFPVSDFLIKSFAHIYVYLYLNETDSVSSKCYKIIERLTKTTISNLINKHFRIILTEFLLQYCSCPEKVLNACRYLACHDPDVSTPTGTMSMSTSQIADFLNPKFLGVLAYFDHNLVNAKVAQSVKRKALKSFPDIMQLMGVKYITPLRFKVLATLRSALPLAKEYPNILAEAWSAFIHQIDSAALGPLLSNLAVSLLQQIEYARQEVNQIFHYLVINNENLLSRHISDLFFVEDTQISDRIKTVIKMHVKRTQPDGFLDKIEWYLNQLNQNIPMIKVYTFKHLNKLLKNNRTEIHKAIFGGKNIDPVIVNLMDSLLMGCKDTDPQVSEASGSCLGQLGAIEAGHLPRQYVKPDKSPFAFSIVDDCFTTAALMELTRAFQYEKDTKNMDCYAFTIQEILKIYDISPYGKKRDVWNSFPENKHQIMYPLLSSRYMLTNPSQPEKTHPLFGSSYATTFLEWAHNWAAQLIPLIETDSVRELLRKVHPSLKYDVSTLFLFLPYVLLHAVMFKANHQYIQEEMMAVIGLDNVEQIDEVTERSKHGMLRHIRTTPSIGTVQAEEGNESKCSKTTYALLDFLNRWLLEWAHSKQGSLEHDNYKTINSFVKKFNKLTIARGKFACGELERALQYLELYIEETDRMQEQLPFMAEIYALLDEPDSIAGIVSLKRSEPSLKELILVQAVTGRLQDAALCYERIAQEGQLDRSSLQGMIDCYLGLDQPFTAYRLISEHEAEDMTELAAEPLWRLGRFEQLEELVSQPVPICKENWGVVMGRLLLAYRKQDHDNFVVCCKDATVRLLAQMDGESKGESALRSGYQSVLGLHIVTEVEHAEEVLRRLKELQDGDRRSNVIINQLLDEWRRRISVVQSDVRTIEPLLRLRRIVLQQAKEILEPSHPMTANTLKSFIGDLWLQSAKHARKAGIFQQAYMYILNAEEYHPEELFIEKSKMYWARGQNEQAFITLRRGLEDSYPAIETLSKEQRKICAKAKLLIAKYNDETSNVDVDVNIGYYKESVEVFNQWEKSLVSLGAYYEKVSSSETVKSPTEMWARRTLALNSYGKALQYGHKYLYQSMPRMLSIWLDVEVTASDSSMHSVLAEMTDIIKSYSERLPLYLYLTAFSQIVSRICHPVQEVYKQLKAIIVKLIKAYPHHALWMMMCVMKSGYPQRKKRCADVFSEPALRDGALVRLVGDFTLLAERLIELCNKPIAGNASTTTVSSLVRSLPVCLTNGKFSHIMMPFQDFCKIVLPSKAARQERLDFNIPTEPPVYIAGIKEHISILPSLQKPRKVTLIGSDGKDYIIMLKPRDDLRKDYRLMEFNGVVNRFLQDAPETRKRRLYIRTYCVLPLNEECGLIEWVPNLVGLRPILIHIYKQKGMHTSNKELKEMMCTTKDPVEKKRRIFEDQLLPRHPPVLQEWFRGVFSDPYGWYQARSAYIRTAAVMSMVGYILGLGDRHGENISFDSTNGDTVHVDFNCLFNRGERFEWPERVPFRLTHNMEAAMGPLKHEGMFRKSCEAVMRVLRSQTAALMSVIDPFVYDPLVSWGRANRAPDCGERTNEQAMQHLQQIRQRLNGMVRTKNKQPSLLSPEGQVEHLIVEATSIHNLCQMYIGWGPFL
ncbi:serine/threonine-protein kinase ATR [Bombyx mori]|uniref:Serine/threonine-protein kinase ATR n=1 Tax=Bombyx mori TaxID=7091 RepID=A0A8R2C952_BOMMO|nr:serine/threonine-protein kinase ATR [Bombyx mori]